MGKIVTTIATSLDGYIADMDGGYSWIRGDEDSEIETKLGEDIKEFEDFIDTIDIVVMGRICYEENMHEQFKGKMVYIITSDKREDGENIRFIAHDEAGKILVKDRDQGKNIYIFGGGRTITPFIENNLIDEYEIGIIPVLLGKGRKLFFERNNEVKLKLKGIKVEDGITVIKYVRKKG